MAKRNDAICGVIGMIVAIALFIGSAQIGEIENETIGADFVPKIVASLLFILSTVLLYQGKSGMAAEARAGEKKLDYVPYYKGTAVMFILLIIYCFTFSPLGFIVSSAIYLFLALLLMSKKEETKYKQFVVISIAGAVLIDLLFSQVFGIRLPMGILG